MPGAYDHVIFDLDGTLADTRIDLSNAVNHVRRSLGLGDLPVDVVCRMVGEGARTLVQRALGPEPGCSIEDALARFLEYYGVHLLDHTRAYPGVSELLAALAERGVRLSVLTNKPAAMSRAILDGLGLSGYITHLIGGDSLPVRKPDPAAIERLCQLAGVGAARTLVVGDSAIDMQTARAAGVAFCGVAWGLAPDTLRAVGAAPIIEHPAELLRVVGRV
jgi:phosphoglycolate phosphatase